MISNLLRRLIRISSFVGKEVRELWRQPGLLLALLLGPFLILLIFGAGYTGALPTPRAILVVPADPAFTQQIADIRQQFGESDTIALVDVTSDLPAAQERLRRNEVDVVIAIPADAARQIGGGAQAILPVYYNQIDPVGEGRLILGTLSYTNDLNKETVARAVQQSQGQAGTVKDALARLDAALGRVDDSVQRGDTPQLGPQLADARGASDAVTLGAGLVLQLLSTAAASSPAGAEQRQNLAQTGDALRALNADLAALQQELATAPPDVGRVHQRTEAVRADVRALQALTAQFQSLNPYVLAAPFFGQARNLAGTQASYLNFYAPGVVALLLQHIAVTLGALSMVRERLRGSLEIFRVAPITPGEILIGKYVGFTLFLAVLAAILIGLVTLGLGVPMFGDYAWLALSVLLLLFASLGLGFSLSVLSQTESQAVQLAMLTLLTSVFFGGFFLPLESFWAPVQGISYALPVTHGILSLQTIMLRGLEPDLFYPLMLGGLGLLFAAFSMWRFSREFRRK